MSELEHYDVVIIGSGRRAGLETGPLRKADYGTSPPGSGTTGRRSM